MQEYWNGLPYPPPGDLPNLGIKPRSPALQVDSLPSEPLGKPKNTGVGRLFLLQEIFPTEELNWGFLYHRWIFCQLRQQGSPVFVCTQYLFVHTIYWNTVLRITVYVLQTAVLQKGFSLVTYFIYNSMNMSIPIPQFIPWCPFYCLVRSPVRLFQIPQTVACQAPPSMGFFKQEYWSGFPFPSPGGLPNLDQTYVSCTRGIHLFCTSVSLFLLCKQAHLYNLCHLQRHGWTWRLSYRVKEVREK